MIAAAVLTAAITPLWARWNTRWYSKPEVRTASCRLQNPIRFLETSAMDVVCNRAQYTGSTPGCVSVLRPPCTQFGLYVVENATLIFLSFGRYSFPHAVLP